MANPVPRALVATYLCGFFSLSLLQMSALATPLLGGAVGLSAATLGVLAGCRSFAPLVYSIHIGALIDIVGVRRVMLFFSVPCAILPPLFPLASCLPLLIVLQLMLGLASAVVWLAAQAAIARVSEGETRYTGFFSFIAVIGTVVAPLLLGLAWQYGGGAQSGYGLIGIWGLLLTGSALLFVPSKPRSGRRLRLQDVIPDFAAYSRAWTILREPLAAFVIACTFLRLASFGIVESFYPVLLQQNGHDPAVIGTLVAIGNLASSPAALAAGWWVRICRSEAAALIAAIAVSVVAITVVPMLGPLWLLAVSMTLFGFGIGVSLPLVLTMLARGVSSDEQGIAAGLRGTVNRLAAFVLPVLMGLIAQAVGVEGSFWAVGGMLMAGLFVVGCCWRRLQGPSNH